MAQSDDVTAGTPRNLDDDRRAEYAEELALMFPRSGWTRMQARVLSYLMLSTEPYVSSAELITALRASAGSISAATRALAEPGFIRQVTVPGDRSHYFRAEEDVWGNFLATEHRYLTRRAETVEKILTELGPDDEQARKRLENMRDYHHWLYDFHQQMRDAWEEYKRRRDTGQAAGG
ncbi:GbsR/MarR family transcriptional regulator [Phytoactinopolyspora mesophila]|uniref:Transcriptional regulator n=1 Tax=Phytoactinopolyspora mesophila TaxID=2650750 RepID=A0A7K3LZC4_9ACTN|nr:MarR family transcriptional regulator [Phytoactinopolyspora mesophila]NDL56381.1 transcriptional regulator [Phytoactinopolyspora mesophila]